MTCLERLHPIAAFCYLAVMTVLAMLTMHPVTVLVCYLSGVLLCGWLIGLRRLLVSLAYSLPMMLLLALTNPLFVHKGKTVLFLFNGAPYTLEALLYGLASATMLASVFYWCRCYSEIITADKLIYLFGRVVPRLSLVLSMTLALLPKMKRRLREIDEAQKTLGVYAAGGYRNRIKSKLRVLSVLLSVSLEDAMDTANSMRARGYGLRGRTCYTTYRFTGADACFLTVTLLLGGVGIGLVVSGAADFGYYPTVSAIRVDGLSVLLYGAVTLLACMAILMEGREAIRWRWWRSKI